MQNGFDHQINKLHVHCCTSIFYYHKTYMSLDSLKPLKTFWYNSMNAFLTLLIKFEKVNSSVKVLDFLVL